MTFFVVVGREYLLHHSWKVFPLFLVFRAGLALDSGPQAQSQRHRLKAEPTLQKPKPGPNFLQTQMRLFTLNLVKNDFFQQPLKILEPSLLRLDLDPSQSQN